MESTCCISLMSNAGSGSIAAPSNICCSRISQQQTTHCDATAMSNDILLLTAEGLNMAAGKREGLWFNAYPEEIYRHSSQSIFSNSPSDASLEGDKPLPSIEGLSS